MPNISKNIHSLWKSKPKIISDKKYLRIVDSKDETNPKFTFSDSYQNTFQNDYQADRVEMDPIISIPKKLFIPV